MFILDATNIFRKYYLTTDTYLSWIFREICYRLHQYSLALIYKKKIRVNREFWFVYVFKDINDNFIRDETIIHCDATVMRYDNRLLYISYYKISPQ